jgi:hypothetical protein
VTINLSVDPSYFSAADEANAIQEAASARAKHHLGLLGS